MITDSDYKTLEDINVTLNSISLLGTSFIIVTYIFKKKLRTYAYKLVCYMSVSNFLLGLAYLLSTSDLIYKSKSNYC
jgi:hypothetical protein